jgi:hypothetical protein
MTYSQKDRLDRIQHTLLPTMKKNFIQNERKMSNFDIFFGRQKLMLQLNILYHVGQLTTLKTHKIMQLNKFSQYTAAIQRQMVR